MKAKKLSSTMIFLAVTIVAYIAVSVLFCYTTKPAVSKGEFPFSITYAYEGETETFSGILKCEYSGSDTIHGAHRRYWKEEIVYDNPEGVERPFIVAQTDDLQTTLSIYENMCAGYFMGDPLYRDYYKNYGMAEVAPRVEYYDYKNDIFLDDQNKGEILPSIGFEILDFTYAEPIENRFVFSGIKYQADHVVMLTAIFLGFFLLCLIFVRKDQSNQYAKLDKLGIVFNFLVGILAVPFITVACMLFGIVESNIEPINQIIYNIPSMAVLCLALSVAFRRKGFSKSSFFIQFGGVVLFVLVFALDTFV